MTRRIHLPHRIALRLRSTLIALSPLVIACGPHFYQAPPPLARYPERTAGKTWQQLLAESKPASGESRKQVLQATSEFFDALPELDETARRARLQALIEQNRATRYQPAIGNLLVECGELLDAPTPGFEDYLRERSAELTRTLPTAPVQDWNLDDDDFKQLVQRHQRKLANLLKTSQQRLKSAPEGLRPNHLVRHAALLMRLGEFGGAHRLFAETSAEFPTHPRGEVAAFMQGRCSLAITRAMPHRTPEEHRLQRNQYDLVETEFAKYLEAFPEGRFTDDAYGWLGAVAADQNQLGLAIDRQLARLDIQQTREVMSSTLRELDQLFARLYDRALDQDFWDEDHSYFGTMPDFELLASHPDVARLFLFHAVDPAYQVHLPIHHSNETGDRGTLHFLERRILKTSPFSRLALKELGRAIVERDIALDATSHLILGWSALRSDDPAQALSLFDRGLTLARTDELLHARAIALSRQERYQASADAYVALNEAFPDSPLNGPSRFDHALALQRAGEAGEAILMLLDLDGFHDPDRSERPDMMLHPDHEAIQWIDTLAQFAPIEEIRRPLDRLPAGDPRTRILRALVRSRALCQEDFTLAGKHLDEADQPAFPIHQFGRRWNGHRQIHLTPERWKDEFKSLRNTARAIRLASSRDPGLAAAHLRHARQWEALRGHLTLPLLSVFDYSASESPKLDQLRRTNGRMLGISDQEIVAELDSRDELSHALDHYLAAAKSTHPEIAAPALEGANEVLFKLAEFSLYRCSRAVETDATRLSNELVDRLESDFPDRPETARAVRFTFVPPDILGHWMPGDYNPGNADAAIAGELEADDDRGTDDAINQRYQAILASLHFLPHSDQTMAEIRRDLTEATHEFESIRSRLDPHQLLRLVDNLDDLHAAAHTPEVTVEQLSEYAALRLSSTPPIGEPPGDSPLVSFYEFLSLIRPLPNGNELTRQSPARWKKFIETYPKSPKCEAASLRRARILVRHAAPIPHVRAFHFPAAPITHGYKQLHSRPDPTKLGDALQAVEAHRTRFPNGRYHRDIDLLQAACDSWNGETARALKSLTTILADTDHPELLGDASLYFAQLMERLLVPSRRPDLLVAIQQNPDSIIPLKKLARGDTCLSRLRPLIPWIESRI